MTTHNAASGAAWLDIRYPGWATQINTDSFYIGDPCQCVGGQLGIGWITLAHEYAIDHDLDPFEAEGVFSGDNYDWLYQIRCRHYDRQPLHH